MKQIILYISLFVLLVAANNILGEHFIVAGENNEITSELSSDTRPDSDDLITVCRAANGVANITGNQNPVSGMNLARRYRPAGFSFDKLFDYLLEDKNFYIRNSLKNTMYASQEYIARQRVGGYYIYALRRIII